MEDSPPIQIDPFQNPLHNNIVFMKTEKDKVEVAMQNVMKKNENLVLENRQLIAQMQQMIAERDCNVVDLNNREIAKGKRFNSDPDRIDEIKQLREDLRHKDDVVLKLTDDIRKLTMEITDLKNALKNLSVSKQTKIDSDSDVISEYDAHYQTSTRCAKKRENRRNSQEGGKQKRTTDQNDKMDEGS